MRRFKTIFARILLLIASVVFTLVGMEAVMRVFDLGPRIGGIEVGILRLSDNPVLRYENVPGARKGKKETLNADGMRNRDIPVKKGGKVVRVACIGDSITFGYGVGRGASFCAQLETHLNRRLRGEARRFEVLNFGVAGYSCAQIVESVPAKALKYRPDVIVYGYCLNDPQDYSHELEMLLEQLPENRRDEVRSGADSWRRWIRRSRLYQTVRLVLAPARKATPGRHDAQAPHPTSVDLYEDPQFEAHANGRMEEYFLAIHRDPARWSALLGQLTRLGRISRDEDIPVVVLIFPLLSELDDYGLAGVHRRLLEAARGRDLAAFDLLPLYQALENETGIVAGQAHGSSIDPLHPSPPGHALAALYVYRLLRSHPRLAEKFGGEENLTADNPDPGLARIVNAAPTE